MNNQDNNKHYTLDEIIATLESLENKAPDKERASMVREALKEAKRLKDIQEKIVQLQSYADNEKTK